MKQQRNRLFLTAAHQIGQDARQSLIEVRKRDISVSHTRHKYSLGLLIGQQLLDVPTKRCSDKLPPSNFRIYTREEYLAKKKEQLKIFRRNVQNTLEYSKILKKEAFEINKKRVQRLQKVRNYSRYEKSINLQSSKKRDASVMKTVLRKLTEQSEWNAHRHYLEQRHTIWRKKVKPRTRFQTQPIINSFQ